MTVPFDPKAQAGRCRCGGADDMCACQNQPDHETLRVALANAGPALSEPWLLAAHAHVDEGFNLGEPAARDLLGEVLRLRGLDPDAAQLATIAACMSQPQPGQALKDVATERTRQIVSEGWTARHDDTHSQGEMAIAASRYAMTAGVAARMLYSGDIPADKVDAAHACTPVPAGWPWPQRWWKPKTRRSALVRAAALLVAEIERLDRAEARKAGAP